MHRARPEVGQLDGHQETMRVGGPHPNRFEPRGVSMDIAVERSCGPVPGGHMDTNTIFTSLFGGWLKAADKARDRSTFPDVNSVYLGRLGVPHTLVCTYGVPGKAWLIL